MYECSNLNFESKITIVFCKQEPRVIERIEEYMKEDRKCIFDNFPETRYNIMEMDGYIDKVLDRINYNEKIKTFNKIIILTQCEYIVNHFRYLVFKEIVKTEDLLICPRHNGAYSHNFRVNERGKYFRDGDDEHNVTKFPRGFFDVGLDELIEMM